MLITHTPIYALILYTSYTCAIGGTFYQPTVLTDMTRSMPPFTDESFGPLAPLFAFGSDEEAIEMANDTR